MRRGPEECPEYVNSQHQQSDPHQAFRPTIAGRRQRQAEHDSGRSQHGHGGRVARDIKQAVAHCVPGLALHAADVGDGRDVVVVKPVAEAKDCSREQGQSQIDGIDQRKIPRGKSRASAIPRLTGL